MRPFPASAAVTALALAVVVAVAAPRAHAQTRPQVRGPAQSHLDRGLEHYQSRRFDDAAAEFQTAYGIDPHRDVLYVWAQALRLGGRCPEALPLYEKFLLASPPTNEAELARKNADRCRAEAAVVAPPPVPTVPTAAPPAPPPAGATLTQPLPPPPPAAATRPDKVTRVLLSGAALSLATSGGFFLAARAARNDAASAATYGDLQDRAGSLHFRERVAWSALGIGAVLAAAAAIRVGFRSSP